MNDQSVELLVQQLSRILFVILTKVDVICIDHRVTDRLGVVATGVCTGDIENVEE